MESVEDEVRDLAQRLDEDPEAAVERWRSRTQKDFRDQSSTGVPWETL
jgi:hypothetical protein